MQGEGGANHSHTAHQFASHVAQRVKDVSDVGTRRGDSPVALLFHGVSVYPQESSTRQCNSSTLRLLRAVQPVSLYTPNTYVLEIFAHAPDLDVIPVVDNGLPLGLVARRHLADRFAMQFMRELHGKKRCDMFMDSQPLIIDKHTKLQDVSRLVAKAARRHLFNEFIIADQGNT